MTPGDVTATVTYAQMAGSRVENGRLVDDCGIVYLVFCAFIIAFSVIENRNPILTESSADLLFLLLAIGEALFMVTSIAFKTSLMIFFRQFLLERKQRYLVTSITVFYCAISALAFFLTLVPCGTLSHLARKRVDGKCIPTNVWNGLLYAHGAVSALSDWVFALLPIMVLWKSSMPAKKKLGVTLLMVLAVCGSLCAVLRTIYTGSLQFDARYYDVNHKPNYYQVTALLVNMAVLEMGIGITAASVACLMPLFRRCAGWFQRRLATRCHLRDIQRRRKNGVPAISGETSLDQWRKPSFVRPDVASFQSGDLNLKWFGVLPSVDPMTGEDSCG
ncbi:hypothetical protein D6C86_09948 [Aureobasidium pullulans]|uniref:Rhodopsin domain-containing protein n=1 Tax=Aureobasidium pullulans TaxID=5580 RepID=A0A4S9U8B7_AURPU|nr:hypothetical protein D6C94_10710 [Aureobasidium pullulans]THZ33605.1 hypothetical protein D6C87_10754 [Aureobasidium pullulans]THZ53221.1 hypothetical protein D6C86_09948 [Aureobasidium pullulans]